MFLVAAAVISSSSIREGNSPIASHTLWTVIVLRNYYIVYLTRS